MEQNLKTTKKMHYFKILTHGLVFPQINITVKPQILPKITL